MLTTVFGLVMVVSGLVYLIGTGTRRTWARGPIPIGFMANELVWRGYRRAQRWFYLAFVFLGLFVLLSDSRHQPWSAMAVACLLGGMICAAVFAVQVSFNWPKVWIPTKSRDEAGAVTHWFKARRVSDAPIVGETTDPGADAGGAPRLAGASAGRGEASTSAVATSPVPEGATARVTFIRGSAYADWLVSYKVWVDGSLAGKVRNGSSLTIVVPAGRREFRTTVQSRGSAPIAVDLAPAEQISLYIQHPDVERMVERAFRGGHWLELVADPSGGSEGSAS